MVRELNFAWMDNFNQHVSTLGLYVSRTVDTRVWKHSVCLYARDSSSQIYDCTEQHPLQFSKGLSSFYVVMEILGTSIISTTSI